MDIFLDKALECLAGAESEFANGRYNNCANRCFYACFQAAIAALANSGVSASGNQVHLNVTVDVEDTDEVVDIFIDRELEMQVEEELPVYVFVLRPLERVLEELRQQPQPRYGQALLTME